MNNNDQVRYYGPGKMYKQNGYTYYSLASRLPLGVCNHLNKEVGARITHISLRFYDTLGKGLYIHLQRNLWIYVFMSWHKTYDASYEQRYQLFTVTFDWDWDEI